MVSRSGDEYKAARTNVREAGGRLGGSGRRGRGV